MNTGMNHIIAITLSVAGAYKLKTIIGTFISCKRTDVVYIICQVVEIDIQVHTLIHILGGGYL